MFLGILDRIVVVLFAFFFAQVPTFFLQYSQRLSGHVTELQLQVKALEKLATLSGKSLPEYIQKFTKQVDQDFSRQGTFMQEMLQRLQELSSALQALEGANPFLKPFTFLRHLQIDISKETVQAFQPGLSFNLETCLYALLGMAIGTILFAGIRGLARRVKG